MRVWLDDTRPMPVRYTHHARSANEAIEFLKTGKVEEISLDYHLGDDAAYTGGDVAQWIAQEAWYGNIPKMRFRFHSSDPGFNYKMKRYIRVALYHWRKGGKEKGSSDL